MCCGREVEGTFMCCGREVEGTFMCCGREVEGTFMRIRGFFSASRQRQSRAVSV